MKSSAWILAALSNQHIKTEFDCGEAALDDYLKRFAGQHAKSKISKTFVATHRVHSDKVIGYYTLTAGSIGFDSLPEELKKTATISYSDRQVRKTSC